MQIEVKKENIEEDGEGKRTCNLSNILWSVAFVLQKKKNTQPRSNKTKEHKKIQSFVPTEPRNQKEKWNTSQTCSFHVGHYLLSSLLLLVTKILNATDLNPKCEKTKKKQHWRRLRNTKKFKLLYCEKLENKIKVEHPKKFKLLCLRTCTLGFFEIKIAALMCSSTFSAYNMPKNILNHYTTKKGRKHKKLGIWSNEHVGESSWTQKNVNFCIARSQKTK